MLETVEVGSQSVDSYAASAGAEVIVGLHDLARPLRGVRVLHVSATPYGGGVAEILRSEIPLLRDLGLVGPIYHTLWQSLAWIVGILAVFMSLTVRQYRNV